VLVLNGIGSGWSSLFQDLGDLWFFLSAKHGEVCVSDLRRKVYVYSERQTSSKFCYSFQYSLDLELPAKLAQDLERRRMICD